MMERRNSIGFKSTIVIYVYKLAKRAPALPGKNLMSLHLLEFWSLGYPGVRGVRLVQSWLC